MHLSLQNIYILLVTFFVVIAVSVLSSPLSNNENKYKIELYDPRVRSDDGWDKIEYYSDRVSVQTDSFSFLQESTSSDPDPQALGPHRLECDCTFQKANPQGRPDSQYHWGKIPATKANFLSDQKLRNVLKSRAAPGSKIPEVRNLDLTTGKVLHNNMNSEKSIYKENANFIEMDEEKLTLEFLLPNDKN